mmetsp:Transcript_30116/g.30600  ORF Transcript_30116/g.30600 Transcript_30116/m.30600 type:complete len:106 (-) Transcript_30116:25-342(-)
MNSNYSLPVNLGNPEEFSIKEFAMLIKDITGSNSTILSLSPTTDDPRQRKPDITLAKQHLNWQPRMGVRDGLKKTIEYFRTEIEESGGRISGTGPSASRPQSKQS